MRIFFDSLSVNLTGLTKNLTTQYAQTIFNQTEEIKMRRNLRKLTSMLLALALIFSIVTVAPFTANAAETESLSVGAESDDFEYYVFDGNALISDYKGTATQLKIPSEIDGYTVTTIDSWAFEGCTSLTNVIIGKSVTSIGMSVFRGCTSLENVTISEGLTEVSWCAFEGCTSLKSITIPDSATIISDEAFANCNSLKSVKIGNGVTTIGEKAFSGCESLASVEIPYGVTEIGSSAFSGCKNLRSVTIPNTVRYINNEAFKDCTSLKNVYFSRSEEEWNSISIASNNEFLINATIHFHSILGDVNGDSKVSILDATEIQKYLARLSSLSDGQLSVADANGDGNITILDVTEIQKYIAKLVPSLG